MVKACQNGMAEPGAGTSQVPLENAAHMSAVRRTGRRPEERASLRPESGRCPEERALLRRAGVAQKSGRCSEEQGGQGSASLAHPRIARREDLEQSDQVNTSLVALVT